MHEPRLDVEFDTKNNIYSYKNMCSVNNDGFNYDKTALNTKIRPSVLHLICSAFPVCKRTLIELVINELFCEFVTKPDGMIDDAKYGICIPTLYSVLILTICHVHKLKDYEEEWFEEFLKNKKFSFLTPYGYKTDALFNLLNILACFGSLKKRPANMQGVELVLLRLGISFYFSLCYIMDYPFSTNRIIKALVSGAHEWIHGSQYGHLTNNSSNTDFGYAINGSNSNNMETQNGFNTTLVQFKNVSNSSKFDIKRISFVTKRGKLSIQENTIKNLIGVFDDFTIKLLCIYGYRPHCVSWNDITLYIRKMNDSVLLNLFRFTKNSHSFFEDNFLVDFINSFNFNQRNNHCELSNFVLNNNNPDNNKKQIDLNRDLIQNLCDDFNDSNEFKRIIDNRNMGGFFVSSKNEFNSYNALQDCKYVKTSLLESKYFEDQNDDDYCEHDGDDNILDSAFNQDFVEKLYLSSHNKNNALTAISSKIKEIASSKSAKLFSFNKLSKKQFTKSHIKNHCSVKGTDIDNIISKTKSYIDIVNEEANSKAFNYACKDNEPNVSSKRSMFNFSSKQCQDQSDLRKDEDYNNAFKINSTRNFSNYFTHKQQIYESEDNEDPLNVL